MKQWLNSKRKTVVLAALSLVLVLCMGMGSAWAYFTDQSMAYGGLTITEPTTTIEEEVGPGTKDITITNTSESAAVWVRARVYASKVLQPDASGDNWTGNIDTWYTYDVPLEPGEAAQPLHVTFKLKSKKHPVYEPEGAEDGDSYSVIVVYEHMPVEYDANGQPKTPVWD